MSDSLDEGIFKSAGSDIGGRAADGGEQDKVVSARGTEDGLVLRIDGGASWGSVMTELELFLGGRKRFFEGGQVLIEWVERIPSKEQCAQLEDLLRDQYGLGVGSRKRKNQFGSVRSSKSQSEREEGKRRSEASSLVEEIEQIASGIDLPGIDLPGLELRGEFNASPSRFKERDMAADSLTTSSMQQLLSQELFTDDDADAKIVFGTVRSGQRVETPFSLIIIGDVNPGADLVAGGDIIVLGSLRGTAHASAYDDDGFDAVIIALHMRPMQLRIGSIISRGSDEEVRQAEIARIENRRIVVEAFNSRAAYWRKSN